MVQRTADHVERQLRLGLEPDGIRDSCLRPTVGVVQPAFGQIELEVDRQVLGLRGDGETHADLAVGDLACGTCVLPLHPYRMLTLLQESGVVQDPGDHRLALGHRREGVIGGNPAHLGVAPVRVREVQEPLMDCVYARRVGAGTSGDGLDALAFTIAEQPHRVHGERAASGVVAERAPDGVEVALEPLLASRIKKDHGQRRSRTGDLGKRLYVETPQAIDLSGLSGAEIRRVHSLRSSVNWVLARSSIPRGPVGGGERNSSPARARTDQV